MIITLYELWDNIVIYPEKLVYFDRKSNIQDTINDEKQMDDYIDENADRQLLDFKINNDNNTLYIEFEEEEE